MAYAQGRATFQNALRGHAEGNTVELETAVLKALGSAIDNFRSEHRREPDWDSVNFGGGTTTFEVIFTLKEVSIDG